MILHLKILNNMEVIVKSSPKIEIELATKVVKAGGGDVKADGVYPDLTAGDLAGRGESVPAEFGFRASGGKSIKDGRAYIKSIKGNSVVWNQWVDTIAPQDCELSETDNRLTLTPLGGFPGVTNAISMNIVENHVYICISHRIGGGFLNVNCGGQDVATNVPFRAEQGHYGFVVYSYSETLPFTITRPLLIDLTQMFGEVYEPSTIEEFNARVAATLGIDMYAYNEGQVIHCNTESIKSVGDNAWDEQWEIGAINQGTGESFDADNNIRSKDYNRIIGGQEYSFLSTQTGALILYDEHYNYVDYWNIAEGQLRVLTIADNAAYFKICLYDHTYKNGTMLRLNHSGWKSNTGVGYEPYWQDTLPLPIISKYFPDGMKSAGSAHDEIRFNKASGKWEYSKGKIKSVDLGSLTWEKVWYNEAEAYRIFANIPNKAAGLSNILCGAYTNANVGDGTMADKSITGNDNPDSSYIYIKDSSYSAEGVDALIASLQDVMLYYESNNWEWVKLDAEDQNFRDYYKVADFGTEMSQSEGPSAPFSADIIYQFNAVDMIREHELEITELQKVIATMQAQLTSLINGGQ